MRGVWIALAQILHSSFRIEHLDSIKWCGFQRQADRIFLTTSWPDIHQDDTFHVVALAVVQPLYTAGVANIRRVEQRLWLMNMPIRHVAPPGGGFTGIEHHRVAFCEVVGSAEL